MRWSACPMAHLCAGSARWQKSAAPGRRAPPAQLPQKSKPKPRKIVPVTLALVESPGGGLSGATAAAKGLLAGLWQPVLWEDEHLAGRGAGAAGGTGAGHWRGAAAAPARRKAHLYPHRVAHVRGTAARSGAECPGGPMSGQARSGCIPTPCPGRSGRISRCCCDIGNLL